MPAALLTDAAIKAAARDTARSGKARTLTDAGRRGEGRLLAMIRPMQPGPLVEFYARQIDQGRRRLVKLGTLPTMSLAQAREAFRSLAPVIREGRDVKAHRQAERHARRQLGTLRELLAAYVERMEAEKRRSAPELRRCLLDGPEAAARIIGPDLLACDVSPEAVADWLRPIHARGSVSMADQARRNLSAAFNWAARNENDYRNPSERARRWSIKANPAAMVPVDTAARRAGTRHLSPEEFARVWFWLASEAGRTDGRASAALRIIMATGQRVEEVLSLRAGQYAEGWLSWPTTKTGTPHAIPLPHQARALLDSITPNAHGLYFPGLKYRAEPFPSRSCDYITRRCAAALEIAPFCPRDLRRTFATLAADLAGLNAEEIARIQNHQYGSRVAEKHYSRATHAELKTTAMKKWAEALARIFDAGVILATSKGKAHR